MPKINKMNESAVLIENHLKKCSKIMFLTAVGDRQIVIFLKYISLKVWPPHTL